MRRWLFLALLFCLPGCGKQVPVAPPSTSGIVERDRELYEQAMKALRKNRFTVAGYNYKTSSKPTRTVSSRPRPNMLSLTSFYFEAGHSNLLARKRSFGNSLLFSLSMNWRMTRSSRWR
jgi:hypothetical protein